MTTAPTPEEVHALVARLEHCVAKWGKQNALSLEAYSAVKMMRRLQAEIDRLLDQTHKLEMDALDLASENSILKRAETDELEARKPLPPDALADKCEAWLQAGGAANVVDAFEAGYQAAENVNEERKQ